MTRRSTLCILAATLLLPLGGCMTWQPVTASPESLFESADPPDRVRVTRADGLRLTLERPVLRAGAIVGTASAGAVLVENIDVLEVRGVSILRSVGFGIPAVLILAVVGKESCRC